LIWEITVSYSGNVVKGLTGQKSSAWFWVGVTLLTSSILFWLILIWGVAANSEDIGDTVLAGVIFTAIPIGIGIYGIRRGRRAQAVEVQRVPEPAAKPVQETQQSDSLVKGSKSQIVIKMPWWFRVFSWPILLVGMLVLLWGLAGILAGAAEAFWISGIGLLVVLFGIWMVSMTTKVIFGQPPGYMTVTRGHIPLFLWFLRTRVISKEEARTAFVRTFLRNTWDRWGGMATAYELRVVTRSGKEVKLYDGGWKGNKAGYLAKRILDFAQEAEVEVSLGAKFSMRVDEVFQATLSTGALGMVVEGTVEHGTIRNGDDVQIRGRGRTRNAKVFEVDTLKGSGAQGERVRLLIEDLTENDVKVGDLVEKV